MDLHSTSMNAWLIWVQDFRRNHSFFLFVDAQRRLKFETISSSIQWRCQTIAAECKMKKTHNESTLTILKNFSTYNRSNRQSNIYELQISKFQWRDCSCSKCWSNKIRVVNLTIRLSLSLPIISERLRRDELFNILLKVYQYGAL